jgi:CubicO group peptidase (beta-lactamase class C family)
MGDRELDQRIKEHLSKYREAGRGLRLRDLLHLSTAPERQARDIDQALQRLRRAGEISFDTAKGWSVTGAGKGRWRRGRDQT